VLRTCKIHAFPFRFNISNLIISIQFATCPSNYDKLPSFAFPRAVTCTGIETGLFLYKEKRPSTNTGSMLCTLKTRNVERLLITILDNVKVKVTLVQALRLCTGLTAHRASRGIALLFYDQRH